MVWCLIGRQVGLEGVQMTSSQQVLGCQGPRVMKPHLLIPEIRPLRPAISCRNLGTPKSWLVDMWDANSCSKYTIITYYNCSDLQHIGSGK